METLSPEDYRKLTPIQKAAYNENMGMKTPTGSFSNTLGSTPYSTSVNQLGNTQSFNPNANLTAVAPDYSGVTGQSNIDLTGQIPNQLGVGPLADGTGLQTQGPGVNWGNVGTIGNLALGAAGLGANIYYADKNLGLQKDQQNWDRDRVRMQDAKKAQMQSNLA